MIGWLKDVDEHKIGSARVLAHPTGHHGFARERNIQEVPIGVDTTDAMKRGDRVFRGHQEATPQPGAPARELDPVPGVGHPPHQLRSMVTVTSKHASADARDTMTPASAARVRPNFASSLLTCQPSRLAS